MDAGEEVLQLHLFPALEEEHGAELREEPQGALGVW